MPVGLVSNFQVGRNDHHWVSVSISDLQYQVACFPPMRRPGGGEVSGARCCLAANFSGTVDVNEPNRREDSRQFWKATIFITLAVVALMAMVAFVLAALT
jgi:hypothetical protein